MATPVESLSSVLFSSPSPAGGCKTVTQKSEILIAALNLLARNLPLPPDVLRAVSEIYHGQTGDEKDADILNCGKLLEEFDVTMLIQQINNLSCSDLKFPKDRHLDTTVQRQIFELEALRARAGEEMQLTWLVELHKLWHSGANHSVSQSEKKQLAAVPGDDQEAYIHIGESSRNEHLKMLLGKTSYLQHHKDSGQMSKDPVVSSVSVSKQYEPDDGRFNQNFIKVTEQPSIIQGGKLRSYQLKGLQWMAPCIDSKGVRGTHLIIAPEGALLEWQHEFRTQLPSITTVLYSGETEQRKKLRELYFGGRKFNVLLTHYHLVRRDKKFLSRIFWYYLIVDEFHRLKNHESALLHTLKEDYYFKHGLLLTAANTRG